jgi:hypothetical protein
MGSNGPGKKSDARRVEGEGSGGSDARRVEGDGGEGSDARRVEGDGDGGDSGSDRTATTPERDESRKTAVDGSMPD